MRPRANQSVCSERDAQGSLPTVLVVTDDFDNMVEVRVRIPFDAMYKAGLIAGYHVLHRGKITRSIGVPAEIARVDVLWTQRLPGRNFLFLLDLFKGKFVYDIDDNFLVFPSQLARFDHAVIDIVKELLADAKVVTATSARLLTRLQLRSGVSLMEKAILAPNMAEEVRIPQRNSRPTALLLAASSDLPLTVSREAFSAGVRRFVERNDLGVIYVGNSPSDLADLGNRVRSTGMLDYLTYREFIRRQNAIAIVPLEGRGDVATTDFVESKSDIKMVEYGSCGIPGVYADVETYRDTPLRGGALVDMGDAEAIDAALEHVARSHRSIRRRAAQSVLANRLAATCVRETWAKAVDAARLPHSIALDDLIDREAKYSRLSLSSADQLTCLHDPDRLQGLVAGIEGRADWPGLETTAAGVGKPALSPPPPAPLPPPAALPLRARRFAGRAYRKLRRMMASNG